MPIAKSVQDVILGEAAYTGVKNITYADMMGIASVIQNRSIALGVPMEDVVSVNSEFNAYGNRLPPGVEAYREMAQEALNDVQTNGSITDATFYATPAAAKNLPSGLTKQAAVPGGHVYFSDPYERAIKTSVGFRAPQELATVRAMVDQRVKFELEDEAVPTPEERPDQTAVAEAEPGFDASRFGDRPAPTSFADGMAAQRDYVDPNSALSAEFDASRFGDRPASQTFADAIAAQRDYTAPTETAGFDPGRFGAPAFDTARMAPSPALSEADRALQTAMVEAATKAPASEVSVSSALMSPVSLENVQAPSTPFSPTDQSVLGPEAGLNAQMSEFTPPDVGQPTGINSPEHQQMIANVEKQLANPSITAPDPNAALSAPADVASMTTDVTGPSDTRTDAEIAADFAQEVGSQKTSRITPMDDARMKTNMQVQPLETVAVPEQPEVAPAVEDPNAALSVPTTSTTPKVAPAVTQPSFTNTQTNPMQSAADRALGSAMGVWSGQSKIGLATDGSTVARLDDGRVARYNPKYDQTEYTSDEGGHWTGRVKGNKIPPIDPNAALSKPPVTTSNPIMSAISPGGLLGGGLFGKLVGVLSGMGSPTGVAPQGTDGGMRVADHGAPGAPGGHGPGGTGSSAGGYGTTGGKDPEGTY